MRSDDKSDRIGQIRERMAAQSQPKHDRRSTDRPGFQVWGDRNVYATNVIYQFASPSEQRVVKAQSFTGIDWTKAPKLARWWAVDGDGQAHWYCMPNVAAFTAFWYAESVVAPNFGFDGDWRESLVERPPG